MVKNASIGTSIGLLTTTDGDVEPYYTYTLVSGTGSTDNSKFAINGGGPGLSPAYLVTNQRIPVAGTYSVRVRSTNPGVAYVEKAFSISVISQVYSTNISLSKWQIVNSKLHISGVVSNIFVFTIIDPVLINGMGGTKDSTLSASNYQSLSRQSASADLDIDNSSHFLTSQWTSLGWTSPESQMREWASRHIADNNSNVIISRVTISGSEYVIGFIYDGDNGTPAF